MPFLELKRRLAAEIAEHLKGVPVSEAKVLAELGAPPDVSMGHIAFPCFALAKILKKKPNEIAADLAGKLDPSGKTAKVAGPYLNVRWDAGQLYETTFSKIKEKSSHYGEDEIGKGERVIIEYCSPNIAKKLAFHHIRSTLLGSTLSNVYSALGYEVIRMNFVGDWGAQFARLLAAFDLWGDEHHLDHSNIPAAMEHLSTIYVRFHKELDNNPECMEVARTWLQKLESGDKKAVSLWEKIRNISLASMQLTLDRIGVQFDYVEGESTYIGTMDKCLDSIKEKAKATKSEGAWIVEIEGLETPALVQKSDGTTLYLTRDVAAAIDRYDRFQFKKSFYVVSSQQSLHFKHLFGTLDKMGYSWAGDCEHLAFGTVLFGSEKMSTREGNVVLLDDVLSEAKKLALEECTKKNPELVDKESVAEKVGVGAIVFGELSSHKGRDINFAWEHVLAFDGETGPYVQYAVVRCNSLLKKAEDVGVVPAECDVSTYAFGADEEALTLALSKLRAVLHHVCAENEPFHLTKYLIDVAKIFNRFYYRLPVLQATDAQQKQVRLNLVYASRQTLTKGLSLLGIQTPEEM